MLNRRQMLNSAGVATLGVITSGGVSAQTKRKARTLAHFTDLHITDERDSPHGAATMFRHMFQRKLKPELVLNTGDAVMAVDGNTTGQRAAEQIALWKNAVNDCPAPIRSCLGNHDVWNGNEPSDEVPIGKKGFTLMTEVLEMPAPYYSFDHGGWHFIALNSLANWPDYGVLTQEHFDWLIADLKNTPSETPVCVLSHLPIVSVTSSLYGDSTRKKNTVEIPKVWQHIDCWAISEVFRRHPNVRLCLSGHMHTQDECVYRGVTYICGGAASGAWWNGSEYGFPPCYGTLTLSPDGHFEYEFIDYGWKANQWRGKQLKLS